ncbi:pectin methylesterase [Alteromonas pelagimontana]|uniref:Pectin methylesterase n=1 Tax=Alteromonas pelagimontana TaxID=1858656 RepID=A0A6M4MC94_9ALTE|nr:pectinesterase family protein [Alteromonas pelagimontana]QJR80763.1 pectin methylesterase [Alteromonas pelagimontana]
MKLTNVAAIIGGILLIAGCGEKSSTNVKLPPDPALTGVFVDSPVAGLGYQSDSVADGQTNENGEFFYFRGEQLTFHIGELTFPAAPASSVMSPLDMFTTDNAFHQSVVNTLRLLQSLDTDGDPDNGISLSSSAASVATATLDEGQTLADFFNQSDADFAADVEVWLGAAGGASSTLVDKATAISHFVNYLENERGTLFPNTFDVTKFTGDIYAPYLSGKTVIQRTFSFTPDDENNVSGTYSSVSDEKSHNGNYHFAFGRKVLVLASETETQYLISRSYNTVNDVYSLCTVTAQPSSSLVSYVETCLAADDPMNAVFTFTEAQAAAESERLEEAANSIQAALEENFDTDTDTFFSSSYKRLSDAPDAGALYYVTGGSPMVDASTGQMTLEGDRFTIGNAAENPAAVTSASDTVGQGIYNLSEGFTISFDVVSHSSAGTLSLYVDNNTTGQDNSVHGGASKFASIALADGDLAGSRFSYTYAPGDDVSGGDPTASDAKILDSSVTNSFFQLRTDSSGVITIDNLKIETIAGAVAPPEPPIAPEPEEPEEPVIIPTTPLPVNYSFANLSEDIFSTNFSAIENAAGEAVPMLTITGGGVTQLATGIQLDGGRFTLGNTEPDVQSSGEDTSVNGALDLSRPYRVIFDVISAQGDEGDNNFQIYVDNNTSGSANSYLGGNSRFYNEPVSSLVAGTTVSIEGQVASQNSYLQFRSESGSVVVIDNIRIEYIDALVLLEETFETDSDAFFTAGYKATDGSGSTSFYSVTGGGSGLTISNGALTLDSARFTLGNTAPDVETSGEENVTTGILDLSREYVISMDIVAVEDTEGNNNFIVYVDNNTSSGSKSIHGDDSKFYSVAITSLTAGQRLTIPGFTATSSSFLQFRTESGGKVTIDNLVISYLDDAPDTTLFECKSEPDLYFCEDFAESSLDNLELIADSAASAGSQGTFDILNDNGNNVLRYTAGGEGGEIFLLKESALAGVPDTGDYFVEARIRPRQNSTTRNKQLFLLGRYESAGNWYGGGLNVQNANTSTQVEVAISKEGSISRPVQLKSPIELGAQDDTDGVWYRVRFDMVGDELTVYLNGENMGTTTDSRFTAKGLIGLFTNNRSFELDDIKVGDPTVKPVQLSLDYTSATWETTTSEDPLYMYVTAVKNDGITEDSFSVASSDSRVVSVAQNGPQVVLTASAAGTATITFTSGSDPTLYKTLTVSVGEGFTMPAGSYGDLFPLTSPFAGKQNAYVDTTLRLTFDTAPTLGEVGEIRIYKLSDDTLVDVISVGTDLDAIGYDGQDRLRHVTYRPVQIDGNALVVKPHNHVLEYNESYYVAIGESVVSDTTLNGTAFSGLGKDANWTFHTREAMPEGTSLLVDDDGEADFRTVQGALNYVMQHVAADTASTITIRDGSYEELLFLRGQNNITIQGESRDNTIVYYDNFESFNGGSGKSSASGTTASEGGRSVFLIEGADNLTLHNFTLKNSHIRSNAYSNQAETLYFNNDEGRLSAINMNFVSEQDTLLLKGYSWFYESLIAGNVDFIWGYVNTALFEDSEIRTIGDSKDGDPNEDTAGGYILQARVPDVSYKGFVFLNNSFTNGPGPIGNGVLNDSTYIARSGGSDSYFDNITLINNRFDTHIAAIGWAGEGVRDQPASNPATPSASAGWREYGSMDMQGNLLDLSSRESVYLLSDAEVTSLTSREAIFAHYNNNQGWLPTMPAAPDIQASIPTSSSGFAQYNYTLTGGEGGSVVTVDNGASLQSALDTAKAANTPVTIYVDGTITDANTGGTGAPIEIRDMNDVSIIGVANRGELDGIGILIKRANNVIVRNLKIHHVLTEGKDAIAIEGDTDGSTTSHIWIDHNELYSTLSVDKDYYDGLLDSKRGAKNITISYNYLHDHWKGSLHGHTEEDTDSANTDRMITFHHNRFENIESRLPLFRYGVGHLYNNYYNHITSTAINARQGAELRIDNNVFENTQNPIVSFYSDVIGYWNTSGNLFGEGVTWTTPEGSDVVAGPDATPTSSYEVPYDYTRDDTARVKAIVINNAGVGKIIQDPDTIPDKAN